jgi:hypothetical protein
MANINILKRKIRELESKYEELRASVGYEELKGWKPNKRIEAQYGWVYAWLYPLNSYMETKIYKGETEITPDVRNEIMSITTAIISQLSIHGKYGVKIPFEPKEVDISNYFAKQNKYRELDYAPCDICGENRITHECHIIPRAEGGPLHRDNFFTLCPLHHHLFDHSRLNKTEWEILSGIINKKMQAAIVYFHEVREKQQKEFWAITE